MPLLQKAYLGATPLFKDLAWYESYNPDIIQTSAAVTVTADTNAHTKGAWSEMIASSSVDASMIIVIVQSLFQTNANSASLMDVGFGASGSEVVKIENVGVGGGTSIAASTRFGHIIAIPFQVPSGTRIAIRMQSVITGGRTGSFRVVLINNGDYSLSPTSVDTIGSDTATSEALNMSGASGTYVEAIASTSQAYRAVALVPSVVGDNTANATVNFTAAVGAAGSEVNFGQCESVFTSGEQNHALAPYLAVFGRDIPAGSRIAVKHNIASNPSNYGCTVIGIP